MTNLTDAELAEIEALCERAKGEFFSAAYSAVLLHRARSALPALVAEVREWRRKAATQPNIEEARHASPAWNARAAIGRTT